MKTPQMYLLVIEDRHFDDEYHIYHGLDNAVSEAKRRVADWPRKYDWTVETLGEPFVYCAHAVDGDYVVSVIMVDVEDS